jgi:hypothetical protein
LAKEAAESGEDETIPVKHLREAIELMLIFTSQFAVQAASTYGTSVSGKDPHECQEILIRFADLSHYAGVGAALIHASAMAVPINNLVTKCSGYRPHSDLEFLFAVRNEQEIKDAMQESEHFSRSFPVFVRCFIKRL